MDISDPRGGLDPPAIGIIWRKYRRDPLDASSTGAHNRAMNDISKKIEAVLTEVEEELRKLIGEAGLAGDYEAVDLSRVAASRIREVRDSLCNSTSSGDGDGTQLEPVHTPRPAGSRRRAKKTRKRSGGKAGGYPKFFTRNGTLCKVGWSKKAKSEYVHKVSKDAFDHTVTAITSLAASSKDLFTAEQVVERTERDGEEIPAYQVYVILALLREKQVLHREGREGYRVISPNDLPARSSEVWDAVEETTG